MEFPAVRAYREQRLRQAWKRFRVARRIDHEEFTLVPLAILVIVLGFYPHPVLNLLRTSTNHLVDLVWEAGRVSLH